AGGWRPAPAVKPGELGLVLGRSPESGANASFGIVSAVSGPWRTWRGGKLEQYIRLDAHLFPHSSGGAVVNARGELIGLATGALSRIAGLAIPVATVQRVAPDLLATGHVPQGFLGVGVQPVQGGLIVLQVEPEGPAAKAGVLVGDILTAVDGTALEGLSDLQAYCDSTAIGRALKLRLLRGGNAQETTLTVQARRGRG
ncbi:MAG: S1C family serine protease, partial [Terriglobales bacterium]